MFRLIRLCIYALAIFVAGMMFERAGQQDSCLDQGGSWVEPGFCDRG